MRNAGMTDAPEWTRDLVIYEINLYAFTSPDGAGDGGGFILTPKNLLPL